MSEFQQAALSGPAAAPEPARVGVREIETAPESGSAKLLYFSTGPSNRMSNVRRMIEQVAGLTTNVLMTGESGTGKERAARYIHALSPRRDMPFVSVNCGAIPADLLESELFGHDKGAVTGAISSRVGRLAAAEGGTLFLDEIGGQPVQIKLLRVLQDRAYERIGSNRRRSCDVRIIAATHRDLEDAVRHGTFREDLFYRLDVFPIELPPLRDRIDDLPYLVQNILERCGQLGLEKIKLSPGAVRILEQYDWPGNIRELANLMERLCVLYPGGEVTITHLPTPYTANVPLRNSDRVGVAATRPSGAQPQDFDLPSEGISLKAYLANVEIALIRRALYKSDGVIAHAARRLQIRRTTLAEKMKRYGITAGAGQENQQI